MPATETTVREIALENPASIRVFEKLGIDYCCGGHKLLTQACTRTGAGTECGFGGPRCREGARGEAWNRLVEGGARFPLRTYRDEASCLCPGRGSPADAVCATGTCTAWRPASRDGGGSGTGAGSRRGTARSYREGRGGTVPVHHESGAQSEAVRAAGAGLLWNGKNPDPSDAGRSRGRRRDGGPDPRGDRSYTAPADACPTYRAFYQALGEFECDLHQHVHLENNILFPRAIALEESCG